MSSLKNYIGKTGKLPDDALLGHLSVTTVLESAFPRDEIVELFKDIGLDASLVPPVSTPLDAFNKASRKREYEYEMENGSKGLLRAEDVTSPNPREIAMRAIVRKEQVRTRSALDYTSLGEVRLFLPPRKGASRTTDPKGAKFHALLNEQGRAEAKGPLMAFLRQIETDYHKYLETIGGDAVRKLIRTYLRKHLNAVKIKESVYFVPISHHEELSRLQLATQHIEGCTLDLIPLVDLADQREHIIRAFQEDTEEQYSALAAELIKLQQTKVTPGAYARLLERYNALTARTSTYEGALGEAAVRTSTTVDTVRKILANLGRTMTEGAK